MNPTLRSYIYDLLAIGANAPTWLAACIVEIEQLRAEVERLKAER